MKRKNVNIIHEPNEREARKRAVEAANLRYVDVNVSSRLREYAKGKKYYVRTYGCQANVRDGETMMGLLEEAGFTYTNQTSDADLIILNTCAIRENAEDKVYGEVGSLKALKMKNPKLIIALGGCMSQQEVVVSEIVDKYPQVDLIFGTHNIENILDYLTQVIEKRERYVDVLSIPGEVIENLPVVRSDRYKAFVNIIYGCNKFCSYCIVPYTRGRERSRLMEDVLAECKQLVDAGYQEITLLGQNVNAYGKDFNDGTNFATLLAKVAELGIPRLRFMTSHPWDFTDDMLHVIAKYPNIMKAIHLPVQSGSSEVLQRMGRRYNAEQYLTLVKKIRAIIPGVMISTDIIVGFPNESEEQFLETLKVVNEVQYDSAFTFIYSPRPGTPAAKMDDNVSDEEKHDRYNRLSAAIDASVSASAQRMVGNIYPVLVDSLSKRNDQMLSGYTEGSKLVNFPGSSDLIGKIINVKIVESKTYSLRGEIVND